VVGVKAIGRVKLGSTGCGGPTPRCSYWAPPFVSASSLVEVAVPLLQTISVARGLIAADVKSVTASMELVAGMFCSNASRDLHIG
jgi:hypothetical protein